MVHFLNNRCMKKTKFSLATYKDLATVELIQKTNHKILAIWAIDCTERVMPFFEKKYLNDGRPRSALKTLEAWISTGSFKMVVIRKASLDSHAAAKEIGNDSPAASVAHAAGQAVATAHVSLHALGAANYALQAIYRFIERKEEAFLTIAKERKWQLEHLFNLSKS